MGKVMYVVSQEEVLQAMADVKKELLNPERFFGAWFGGDEKKFDEWAGEVGEGVSEVVFETLEKLGIFVS